MTENEAPTVARNDVESRYEIRLGETLAGYTEFRMGTDGELIFPHTVIDPAFSGRGLGGTLVEAAMADVSARGETVVPLCPFVVKYLDTHDVPGLIVKRRSADL